MNHPLKMADNESRRSKGKAYKYGVYSLMLGSLLYIVGFSSPYWIKGRHLDYEGRRSIYLSRGLWMECVDDGTMQRCASNRKFYYQGRRGEGAAAWHTIVQVVQCAGLIGVAISCAGYCCCSTNSNSINRTTPCWLPAFTCVSGILGFIGAMIYLSRTRSLTSMSYAWSFGLDLAGSVIIILAALVTGFAGRSPRGQDQQEGAAGDDSLNLEENKGDAQSVPPSNERYSPDLSHYYPTTYDTYSYSGCQMMGGDKVVDASVDCFAG